MVEESIANETKQSSVTISYLLCLRTNQRIKSAVEHLLLIPAAFIQTLMVRAISLGKGGKAHVSESKSADSCSDAY